MLRGDIINARARAGSLIMTLRQQIILLNKEKDERVREQARAVLTKQLDEAGALHEAFSQLEHAMGARRGRIT